MKLQKKLASRTNTSISTFDAMKILFPEMTQKTPRERSFFVNFRMEVCQEETPERIFEQWRAASVYSLEIFLM